MLAEALMLPQLFFKEPLEQKEEKVMVAQLCQQQQARFWPGPVDYDKMLFQLLDEYEPAKKACLILSPHQVKTSFARVYWPQPLEEAPPLGHNTYGVVLLVDDHRLTFRTWILKYCSDVLVFGGVLAIVHNGRVIIKIEKE